MIEFNTGFLTALTLFYGHRMQFQEASKIIKRDLRVYGAADHLFDIKYPEDLDPKLKKKVKNFVASVFRVRLENLTLAEGDKIFDKCLELIKEIDRKYFGQKRIIVHYK